jgi:FkbM family methyltransferase
MKQLIYRLIYNKNINLILRNINKLLNPIFPFKIPPSGILRLVNAEGRTLKLRTNQTNYLSKLIFWEGGYQKFEYTNIFISLVQKVNSFFDIGANIGFYSLIAAHENKNIEVVGFEPATGPLYYFTENVRINKFSNIKIEPIALSHRIGEIEFYEIKNQKYKYLKHNLAGESNTKQEAKNCYSIVRKVKTVSLDEYVLENKIKSIDLIKMDTEGTENLILERSGSVLKEMRPIIICETLFNVIEAELEDILRAYGYEFYNHTELGLKKQDTIKRDHDNGVRNCFFVHPSKYHLIKEYVID